MNKNDENALEKELTFLQRIELAGKIAAASLPLAYISGYLIYTSYLGTYGIQLGTSDLLRSKYIYIGFHYLVFLVAVAAIFRGGMRVVEMRSVFRRSLTIKAAGPFQEERAVALDALLKRNVEPNRWVARRFQEYRGDFVVAVLVLVFGAEILFLNPERLGILLPLQVVYLFGVAIYQYSFYKELREPFTWGLAHGSEYIEDCRWWLFCAQILAALSLGVYAARRAIFILSALIPSSRFIAPPDALLASSERFAWGLAGLSLEMQLLGLVAIMVSTERLRSMDTGKPVRGNQHGGKELGVHDAVKECIRMIWVVVERYFAPIRTTRIRASLTLILRSFFLLLLPGALFYWGRHGLLSRWRNQPPAWLHLVVVYLPLLLSLFVLSNVALIPALYRRRAQRLDYSPHEKKQAIETPRDLIVSPIVIEVDRKREQWERLVRRLVMATVLYVTTVLSFSFLIYPHIPIQKSGGNYATGGRVSVKLVEKGSIQGCGNVQLPLLTNGGALVPLEEDSDYIYLASDREGGGVRCWSWAAVSLQYSYRPRIYTVSRRCIAELVDADPVKEPSTCEFREPGKPAGPAEDTGVAPGGAQPSIGLVPSPISENPPK